LRRVAETFRGKPYDAAFGWFDGRIYCSELVWKIYERALGLRIGRLRKLREFDLSGTLVRHQLAERYGKAVPWDETVISPGDKLDSDLLRVVSAH